MNKMETRRMGDTGKINKELFVDNPVLPPTVPADKEEIRICQDVGVGMDGNLDDGWWSTPEGQVLIEELNIRYSDDIRAESKHTGRCEHVPFIVKYLRLYPEDDILKAAQWYENKGNGGSLKACYHAGLLYEIGHDYLRAAECFTKAAKGDIMHEASFHLGLLYENGLITDGPDIPSAIRCYKKGAIGMDKFSEVSTDALKRLGAITCWAELGYDHYQMIQKRKRQEEAKLHAIQKPSAQLADKGEDTPPVKESFREKAELVGLMLLVLPCLVLSGCYDWVRFRWSDKYRRKVYRKLKKDEFRSRRSIIRPDEEDSPWQRNNRTALVRHIYTDEELYPECRVSLLVPEERDICTDGFTVQEWFSVKVPGRFHCLDYQKPETLKETEFLKAYMSRNGLTDAVVILNDGSSVYERMKRFYDIVHEFPGTVYMGCHVELLTRTEPQSGASYEKVSYRVLELPGRFRLEQDSLHRLDERSERIYGEYKDKVCKLKV